MTIHSKPQIPESLWQTSSLGNGMADKWRGKIDIETIGHCKVLHGKVVNAARKLEFQCEEMSACAPNKRCGNGFCPMCVRRARRYLLDFASSRWLFRLKWHLVTIRVEGWTKEAGDWSLFGPLGSRPDVSKFLDILHRKRPKGLLAIGGIEAVYVTVENMPVGKVFHLHLLISGPSSEDIKAAAAESFNLDKAIKNNPDVKLVREGQVNFFKAFTYVFKQPLAKKSKRHHDEPGVRQTPKSNELRELMSNYGEHRVEDRLILEGFAWEKGALRRVSKPQRDQIRLLPIPGRIVDGDKVGGDEKAGGAENIDSAQKMGNNGLLIHDPPQNIEGKGVSAGGVHPVQGEQGAQPLNEGTDEPQNGSLSMGEEEDEQPENFIEVLRSIKRDATGEYRLHIRFPKFDGVSEEIVIDRQLCANANQFWQKLVARGAANFINFKYEASRLLNADPPIRVRATDAPGWYGNRFVCDIGVLGRVAPGEELIEFDTEVPAPRVGISDGSAQEWVDEMHAFIAMSDYLALTYLCALLPPLAARVGERQGFVVNLVGESTTGKTLAFRLCQSVFARAEEPDLQTFDHTALSLKARLAALSCTAIPFKDVKASADKGIKAVEKFQQMIFAVHGGDAHWNLTDGSGKAPGFCIPMASDERSLVERYAMARVPFEEGDKVRCMELPVPKHGGIFNRLHGDGPTAPVAKSLEGFIKRRYGLIFPVWIDALSVTERKGLSQRFHESAERFVDRLKCDGSLEHRYARPFGLLAATAELAASINLLHDVDHYYAALERLYALGVARMTEGEAAIKEGLNAFVDAIRDRAKFPMVTVGSHPGAHYPAGFVRREGGVCFAYVRVKVFESYFDRRLRPTHTVLPVLRKAGAFLEQDGKPTRPVQQYGLGRKRYLVFDYDKLVAEGGREE